MIVISKFYAPYRSRVFDSTHFIKEVIYLNNNESNRSWDRIISNNSIKLFSLKNSKVEYSFIIPYPSVLLRALRHKIIIINFFDLTTILLLIASKLMCKKIIYFTDIHPLSIRSRYFSFKRFIFDKVIVNYLPKNVSIKNCYISPLISDESFKPIINYKKRKYDIIVVGQLTTRKNYTFLIDFIKKNKKFKYLVVGKGDPKIRKRLKNLGVKVIDNSPYNKMVDFYNNSKVLLAPSRFDVWGLNVQEALLSGCNVIGTNSVGACYAFKSHKNCYVVDSFDLDLWEKKVEEVINSTPTDLKSLNRFTKIEKATKAFENINNTT